MGFSGFEHAFPMANDESHAVYEEFVIVGPDEARTKAQAPSSRKEIWSHTTVARVAGFRNPFEEATSEAPWLQVSAFLLGVELGVVSRRSLFW